MWQLNCYTFISLFDGRMIGARHTGPLCGNPSHDEGKFFGAILNAEPVYAGSQAGFPRKKPSERNPAIVPVLTAVVFTIYNYV